MAEAIELPEGFILDDQPSDVGASGLPSGFIIDEPKQQITEEEFTQKYGDIPDINGIIAPQEPKEEPTLGEKALGVGEAALTTATGAVGGTLGMIGGTFQGLIDEIRTGEFGSNEAANRIEAKANELMSALTYAPRTEQGQEYVKGIGEAGAQLAPLAGLSGPLAQAGQLSKAAAPQARAVIAPVAQKAAQAAKPAQEVAKGVFQYQSPAKQKIAEMIANDPTNKATVGFKLKEGAGGVKKVISDKIDNEALKQGMDKGVIASVNNASKADKSSFMDMLKIMKKAKNDAEFAAENRPSDILGNTLLNRIKTIREANKKAGVGINKEALKLKGKPIDIMDASTVFANRLDELGVKLVSDGKGGLKPDFEFSKLSPGDRGPLKEVIRIMNVRGRNGIDAFSVHEMKKSIDNNVTYGRTKTGISRDAEKVLKEFRGDLDSALDSAFPEYDKVNKVYSETIDGLDEIQQAVGQKLDLSGGNADKALGTKLRNLLSNAPVRVNLLDSAKNIERLAKKHGAYGSLLLEGEGLGGNSLMKQVIFTDELERMFGTTARTSLQGQMKQAIESTGRAASGDIGIADAAIKGAAKLADKAQNINEEAAFRSIKRLLEKGGK